MAALGSLPGQSGRKVAVAVGWRTAVVNAGAMASLKGAGIVVAPPLLDVLTDRQLRAMLAHELAHLRHGDTWWRLLRLLLRLLASAAAAVALYAIPALRSLAGLHTAALTGQSLPFLLAVGYLVTKVLRVAELHGRRAEELAADRQAVQLTGDPQACREAVAVIGSVTRTPESWSLPQLLLTATHPAMGERLRQLSAPVPESKRASVSSVAAAGVIASLAVIALAVGTFTLSAAVASSPPANLGWYRVVPPSRFNGDVLSGARLGGSSVWSDGIGRFQGAVAVTAVYDRDGQPLLYVWVPRAIC